MLEPVIRSLTYQSCASWSVRHHWPLISPGNKNTKQILHHDTPRLLGIGAGLVKSARVSVAGLSFKVVDILFDIVSSRHRRAILVKLSNLYWIQFYAIYGAMSIASFWNFPTVYITIHDCELFNFAQSENGSCSLIMMIRSIYDRSNCLLPEISPS